MIGCEVSLSILRKNLSKQVAPFALMVKANAYGHGLRLTEYADKYVNAYGVATEQEGLRLRLLTQKPILITAPDYSQAALCVKYYLTPMVSTPLQLAALSSASNSTVKIHIKADTGMGRFGAKTPTDTLRLCLLASRTSNIKVTGIGTHFSSREAACKSKQLFEKHIQAAESISGRLLRHAAASGTADIAPFDMRRIGFSAYANVLTVVSSVAAVKRLRKGESTGYNNAYIASRNVNIAVVYGGYADGIHRSAIGYCVKICGREQKIIAVCMDVFMVELNVKCVVGEKVTICSGLKDIEKLAAVCNTIPYEIYVGFAGRCGITYKE